MNTATRIYTIDRASAGLARYEKPRLQLVLRQFGAKTYDWDGDPFFQPKMEYIVWCLENMNDVELAEIDLFVAADTGHVAATPAPSQGKPWTECPTGVFLSHKFDDAEFASSLSSGLRQYGIDGFVAHKDITVSAPWRASIMESLDTCDAFVALMHVEFHQSQWCDQEVGWALGRHVPMLVVRPTSLTGPRTDGFIEQFQHLTVDRANARCVEFTVSSVYAFLAGRPELLSRVAESLVWAIERPQSHPHAIRVWHAMEALDYTWPDGLLRRIKAAEEEQAFVKNAYTIPSAPYKQLKGYEGSGLEAELTADPF